MTNSYRKFILAGGDLCLMYLALTIALWIRGISDPIMFWQGQFLGFGLLHLIWIIILYIDGFYALRRLRLNLVFLQGVFRFALFAGLAGIVLFYLFNIFGITPKTVLVLHILTFLPIFVMWRWLAGYIFRFKGWQRPVVLLEIDGESSDLATALINDPYGPFRMMAVCKIDQPDLYQIVLKHKADTVIVSDLAWSKLPPETYDLSLNGVRIINSGTFCEDYQRRVRPEGQDLAWFLAGFHNSRKSEYEITKRIVEAVGALIMGIILFIPMLVIDLIIKLSSNGPVLFIQKRVGRHGKIFKVLKFRTMTADAEKDGPQWAQKNDPRVTGFGKFLRHTHLDEIPQLWNILLGEMSFIGPRPEQPAFVEELKDKLPYYGLRHLIRPGITGWAQINYRYGSSVDDANQKLAYDLWYVKRRSASVDLKIILKTIAMLFKGEGR